MGIHMSNLRIPSCIKIPHLPCFGEREYVSSGTLRVIREIIITLKANLPIIGHGWMLRTGAGLNQNTVQEFIVAIERGDVDKVRTLMDTGLTLEASQALYVFLVRLDEPLIPLQIQSLVLGSENEDVSVEIIASDVLGLMKEELPENHLCLVAMLLNLFDAIIKSSPADELRGTALPISMSPLFFNMQSEHLGEWRRILTIFVEMIRQATTQLEVDLEPIERSPQVILERTSQEIVNLILPEEPETLQNMIIRRYHIPVGYRGDCQNVEVVNRMPSRS